MLAGAFERGRRVHLLGLVSQGGVHSHIDHLRALLELAPEKTWIHAFTDGRDVSPHAALTDLATLPQDRIATVVGRYYAMDRDNSAGADAARVRRRCSRAPAHRAASALDAVQASYDAGVTDEFIEPIVIDGTPRIEPGDTAIFFNFRPDRGRQLSRRAARGGRRPDDDDALRRRASTARSCFAEQTVAETLAEVLARARGAPAARRRDREVRARHVLLQRRRRARVGGGDADPRPEPARRAELRPRSPAMSAAGVAERFCAEIGDGYGFAVVNFANPDMVGHTGVIPAVVEAVEATDRCLGRVVDRVDRARRRLPRHGRPRQRRAAARGRRRLAAHGPHDEPGAADRDRRSASCATAASSPTSRRPSSACSESARRV